MNGLEIACGEEQIIVRDGETIGISGDHKIQSDIDGLADVHARFEQKEDGRWLVIAVNPDDNPVCDPSGVPCSEVEIIKNTEFFLGDLFCRCIGSYDCESESQRDVEVYANDDEESTEHVLSSGPVIPPSQKEVSLQYFFPHDPLYRISVLGRRESGKTCMLASFSVPRGKNRTDKVICTRVNHLRDQRKNLPNQPPMTPKDKEAHDDFYRGKAFLDEAIDRMKHGKLPMPNSLTQKGRFVFNFSASDRPRRLVESIDYAGELVEPDVEMNREQRARKLNDIMLESDGIIVLAQVSRPENDGVNEMEDANRLAQTFEMFSKMFKDREAKPIAIAVNKWDRLESFDPDTATPESERKRLEDLLDTDEGAHIARLRQGIMNAVGEENLSIFPISALGKCELVELPDSEEPEERPRRMTPLKSFGVEDPFLWLLERADETDITALESKVSGFPWPPWKQIWGNERESIEKKKQWISMKNLARRDLTYRTFKARLIHRVKVISAKVQIAAMVLVMLIVGEFFFSSRPAFDEPVSKLATPVVNNDDMYESIKKAEEALKPLRDSWPIRHIAYKLFVSTKEAENRIDKSANVRKEFLRGFLENEDEYVLDRIEYGRNYLKDFEECSEYPEIQALTAKLEEQLADELKKGMENTESTFKDRAEAAADYLRHFPKASDGSDIEADRDSLNEAHKIQTKVEELITDDKFKGLVDELIPKRNQPHIQKIINNNVSLLKSRLLSEINRRTRNATINGFVDNPLRSITDRLQSIDKLDKAKTIFEDAVKTASAATKDKELYEKAREEQSNRAYDRYLSAIKNLDIPGFMESNILNSRDEDITGEWEIVHIECPKFGFWGRDGVPAEITMEVDEEKWTKTISSGGGGKERQLRGLLTSSFNNSEPITVKLKIERLADAIAHKVFRGEKKQKPHYWLGGEHIEASCSHDIKYKAFIKLHYESLSSWRGRGFQELGSIEWNEKK